MEKLGILKFKGSKTLKGGNFFAERIEVESKFKPFPVNLTDEEKLEVFKDLEENKDVYVAKLIVLGNLTVQQIRINKLIVAGDLNCESMDLTYVYVKGKITCNHVENVDRISVGKDATLVESVGKSLSVNGNCFLKGSCDFDNVMVSGNLELSKDSIIRKTLVCTGTVFYYDEENLPNDNQYFKKKVKLKK